jgi:hypothetical protein
MGLWTIRTALPIRPEPYKAPASKWPGLFRRNPLYLIIPEVYPWLGAAVADRPVYLILIRETISSSPCHQQPTVDATLIGVVSERS